jgi:hypothetical protein
MCHFLVYCCTDPFSLGLHIQMCRFFGWGTISRVSSLHSNMSAYGTWWRWRLIAIILSDVYHKIEDLCNWIYVVIFDTIVMITIFCTVVLSGIQGIALNTGVLPFSKGRALQYVWCYCWYSPPFRADPHALGTTLFEGGGWYGHEGGGEAQFQDFTRMRAAWRLARQDDLWCVMI